MAAVRGAREALQKGWLRRPRGGRLGGGRWIRIAAAGRRPLPRVGLPDGHCNGPGVASQCVWSAEASRHRADLETVT